MLSADKRYTRSWRIILIMTLLAMIIGISGCGETDTLSQVDATDEFYSKIKGTWVNKELSFIHEGQVYFNMMIFDDRGIIVNIVHPLTITGYELKDVKKISDSRYKLTLEFVDGEKKGERYQQEIWFDSKGNWAYPEHSDKKFSCVTREATPAAMEKAIKEVTRYCKKHKKYN